MATFTAAAGQTYIFLLTVTNTDGLSGPATTLVTTAAPTQTQIVAVHRATRRHHSPARARR